MNKAWGAAAILLASLLGACVRLRAKRERIALLCALRDSLRNMQRQIAERRHGLGEIFAELSCEKENGATACFYAALRDRMDSLREQGFSQLWRAAAEEGFAEEELRRILIPLGDCLGSSETDMQLAALEDAARELDNLARSDREKLPGERRMSLALSLCLGAFAVIILM